MRQTRKVLSFVLILALVMGSFSMAFAAGTTKSNAATLSDIAGLLGEDQIEVCQNLGIIEGMPDGTFEPETLVNRAQFAAIITRALGIPESALAGYATSNFNDTSGYGWAIPYLAFCQSKGIMIGDGQGNAMPGRTITVNEAITMILRAIGYVDSAAELVGVWPANYVTLGKALKLYDDVSDDVYMDRENAAIAIYNALIIQLVSIDSDGKTIYRDTNVKMYDDETDEFLGYVPATLANTGLNCTTQANAVLTPADFGNSLINITDKIGAFGIAYWNSDEELVAFSVESTFVSGDFDGDKLVGQDGRKYTFEQKINAITDSNANHRVYVNGGNAGFDLDDLIVIPNDSTKGADLIKAFINKIDTTDGEEVTISAKVSGTTIKRIYAVVGWVATDADQVSSGDVSSIEADQSLLGSDFVLDDDQEIDLKQFSLVGVKSLDDIATDDIVYVYIDENDDIRKVAVGKEVVEGVIDEVSKDEFVIDGTTYEFADDYLGNLDASTRPDDITDDAGSDAVVNLDAYGYAFKVDTTGGETGLFAMVLGTDGGSNTRNIEAKMYTNDDAEKTFTFAKASKVDVYDATATNSKKSSVTLDTLNVAGNGALADLDYNMIGYRLNSDGQITRVDQAVAVDNGTATAGALTIKSKTVLVDNGKSITIAKDATVFTYDYDSTKDADDNYTDRNDFEVSSLSNIDLTVSKNLYGQYILNNKGDKVVAILLPSFAADADSDDVYGVINTISKTKSGDDTVYSLKGFVDGSATTLTTTTDVDEDDFDPTEVGLYKLTKNGDGKVKKAVEVTGLRAIETNEPVADKNPIDGNNIKFDVAGIGTVSDDVVVYSAEWKSSGKYEYAKSSLNSIKKDFHVWMYNTVEKDDDVDSVATVVIYADPEKMSGSKDTTAPRVIAAAEKLSDTAIKVTFNERVIPQLANNAANYDLTGTAGFTGAPTSAVLADDRLSVTLTVPNMSGMLDGQTVIVTVSGVQDNAGNEIGTTYNKATYTYIAPTPPVVKTLTIGAQAGTMTSNTTPDAVTFDVTSANLTDGSITVTIADASDADVTGDFDISGNMLASGAATVTIADKAVILTAGTYTVTMTCDGITETATLTIV